jgi:uncharacterized protein (TIGR03437 family)
MRHRKRHEYGAIILLLLATAGPAHGSEAPTTGLSGYWSFDEGRGDAVSDSSGSGNTGTLSNAPQWTTGKLGAGALNFPGRGLVTIPNSSSLSPASQMTVAFWTRQITVANGGIIGKWDYTNHQQSWVVRARANGAIRVNIAPTVNDPNYAAAVETPAGSWTAGTWHHVAFVFDGSQSANARLAVYIDDAAQALTYQGSSIPASLANAAADITIGAVPDTNPWNGDIDEVRIYGRALTSQEIDAIYHDTGAAGPVTPPAPQILSFTASPAGTIPGQPSLLSWTLSGATSAALDNGVGPQSAASTGWSSVAPAATTTYTLTATNANGSVTAQTTVTVTPRTGTLSVTLAPGATRLGRYEVYELTLTHASNYSNPWEDVVISAAFTAPSGRTNTIGGFYYGPNTWKVRFAPAETGSYTWTLAMSSPTGSYSASGSFESVASLRTGFVRLYGPSAPYDLKTEGNQKAFYPLGIQQGYAGPNPSVLQFFLPPASGEIYPVTPDTYFGTYTASGFNFFRSNGQSANYIAAFNQNGVNTYDIPQSNLIDGVVLATNKYDWKLMFAPIACPNRYVPGFDFAANPAASQALLKAYQYAINRWAAYTDIWELMNENGCPSVNAVPPAYYQWITSYIRKNDPYGHLITTSGAPSSPQPNIEITSPHYYIKGSFNPSLTLDSDVLYPVNSGKTFLSNHPIIIGEIGNDCPVPDADPPMNERYRIMLWSTFFNQSFIVPWNSVHGDGVPCAAGSPANLYVGSIQRAQAAVFSGYVADFDPLAIPLRLILTPSMGETVRGYGLGSGSDIGAYIIHANSHTTPVTVSLRLDIPLDRMAGYWLDPLTGNLLANFKIDHGTQTLTSPTFQNDLVLRIRAAGSGAPAAGQPHIATVVNAASYAAGKIAPGEMVVLTGTSLGPANLVVGAVDPSTGRMTDSLGGTRVLFDGLAAPLMYVSDGQSCAIVPFGVAKPVTQVQVEYAGARSTAMAMDVTDAAPGLFTADSSGQGQGAILNEDGTLNSKTNPAAPGSIIVLYGIGGGDTTPPGQDGSIASNPFPVPLLPVSVLISGAPAPDILYAGAAPLEVAGKFQINVRVPPGTASGDQPVTVIVGTSNSHSGVTAAIR